MPQPPFRGAKGNIRYVRVAIHGDHDPHPARSIEEPLAAVLEEFRFILLDHCGHLPWIEQQARDRFYAMLRAEVKH